MGTGSSWPHAVSHTVLHRIRFSWLQDPAPPCTPSGQTSANTRSLPHCSPEPTPSEDTRHISSIHKDFKCVPLQKCHYGSHLTCTTITVLLPLPRESCNKYVRREFLNGMWVCRALSAWITSPSASRERLIFWASFSLSPSAPDFHTLSEPARSTRFNLPEVRKGDSE